MTDNDIIKALECCKNLHHTECACCPLGKGKDCIEKLAGSALDLISRQNAGIVRLTGRINHLKQYDEERDIRLHARLSCEARTEAIKEFARKLKCGVPQETGVIRSADIDNLVKEMVGEGG